MKNRHLYEAAMKVTNAMNLMADDKLPGKLAEIVKLHAGLAVGSAFIPLPGADMAAAIGNIWTMYVRINKHLNLPFSENIIKSVAAGVVTNIGSAAAVTIVVGSALKFIPGLGTLGGAVVLGSTIYAVTIAAGIVYMNTIAKLVGKKPIEEINEQDLKAAADEASKDKDSIQDILRAAKKDYKDGKKD